MERRGPRAEVVERWGGAVQVGVVRVGRCGWGGAGGAVRVGRWVHALVGKEADVSPEAGVWVRGGGGETVGMSGGGGRGGWRRVLGSRGHLGEGGWGGEGVGLGGGGDAASVPWPTLCPSQESRAGWPRAPGRPRFRWLAGDHAPH